MYKRHVDPRHDTENCAMLTFIPGHAICHPSSATDGFTPRAIGQHIFHRYVLGPVASLLVGLREVLATWSFAFEG